MLHFRFPVALKDLLNNALRRPLPGSVQKTRLSSSAGGPPPLRVLHAASHRPLPRTASCAAPSRRYCVKTEDSVYLDEQLKKDGVNGAEEAGDK